MNLRSKEPVELNKMSEERMSISKSDGKMSKEISVEKVENGYIITINSYGDNDKGEYESSCKKYISTKNPLEKKEESVDPIEAKEEMFSLLDGFK